VGGADGASRSPARDSTPCASGSPIQPSNPARCATPDCSNCSSPDSPARRRRSLGHRATAPPSTPTHALPATWRRSRPERRRRPRPRRRPGLCGPPPGHAAHGVALRGDFRRVLAGDRRVRRPFSGERPGMTSVWLINRGTAPVLGAGCANPPSRGDHRKSPRTVHRIPELLVLAATPRRVSAEALSAYCADGRAFVMILASRSRSSRCSGTLRAPNDAGGS
jgi:hypothetical protein